MTQAGQTKGPGLSRQEGSHLAEAGSACAQGRGPPSLRVICSLRGGQGRAGREQTWAAACPRRACCLPAEAGLQWRFGKGAAAQVDLSLCVGGDGRAFRPPEKAR